MSSCDNFKISDLRKKLIKTFLAFENKQISDSDAKTYCRISDSISRTVFLELEYAKMPIYSPEIKFIGNKPLENALEHN